MIGLHGIPGTFEFGQPNQWTDPGSPFLRYMGTHGFKGPQRAFQWSTFLDAGLRPELVAACPSAMRKLIVAAQHATWKTTPLMDRFVSPFDGTPYLSIEEMNVIAYSFGANPVAYACADGLQINTLLTLGAPVRDDMAAVWEKARPNIRRWWQVYSDFDVVQLLGSDRLIASRKFDLADHNLRINELDHFMGMLHNEAKFLLWEQHGLVEFLRGGPEYGG